MFIAIGAKGLKKHIKSRTHMYPPSENPHATARIIASERGNNIADQLKSSRPCQKHGIPDCSGSATQSPHTRYVDLEKKHQDNLGKPTPTQ